MVNALRTGSWLTPARMTGYAGTMLLAGLAGLITIWSLGAAPLDVLGRPIGTDFSAIWTAGRLAVSGDAAAAYQTGTLFALQRETFGRPDLDLYGWYYPPYLLALAAPLAMLPYLSALMLWQAATLAGLMAVLRRIAPKGPGVLIACIGFPAVFINLGHGQNGFLTAMLLGGGLWLLPRRPILAGICFGLMVYKPQFALALPVLLVAGGHWRALAATAGAALVLTLSVSLWLGLDIWSRFIETSTIARIHVLEEGGPGWHKLQSVFATARAMGADLTLAYLIQASIALCVLTVLATSIRRGADHRLVSALTLIATLLATPYAFDYDLMVLGVAIAFAASHGRTNGFAPWEISALALAWIAPLLARPMMDLATLPVGVGATLALFAVLAGRALLEPRLRGDRAAKHSHDPVTAS